MRLEHLPAPLGRTQNDYGAVVFDMDGVVTDTAAVHAAAWKTLFDEALGRVRGPDEPEFDIVEDYRRWVDGRSREDGVREFLSSRGITLPEGEPDDEPGALTVSGLSRRKQDLFTAELDRNGVRVFPDAAELLRRLRAAGVPTALVTASRNSAAVLAAAGLAELFTVRVDGTDAARLGLPGKPDPAMFLEAACRLGVAPIDAAVLEDATSGVRAAATGGFGLVVGVDRTGAASGLAEAGADVVVTDLADLPFAPPHGRPAPPVAQRWGGGATDGSPGAWNLIYDDFVPAQEGTREALCTTGNGYWASRGSYPGSTADTVHYPGTYLAGVYNRITSHIGGRDVETEHMVNAPDWTYLTVRPADGPVLLPGIPEMVAHHQDLNLRSGVLTTIDHYRHGQGRRTKVTTRRFHSMTDPHLAALEVTVVAENWSGQVVIESGVDGRVANRNVAADRPLDGRHLCPGAHHRPDEETLLYETVTRQSGVRIATAIRTRTEATVRDRSPLADEQCPGDRFTLDIDSGTAVSIEKVAAVSTSRDRAVSTAALDAAHRIRNAPCLAPMLDAHVTAWARLWDRFGIRLDDGTTHRLALNLHIFHVLQTVAAADPDLDAGLPARGLHGEAYRGHIFWDELFVYPMLTLRRPELPRAFLLYRYRRLRRACAAATAAGLDGALFPWQSGSDGRDETPAELLNTRNGQWMPDNSRRQHHVGLALAYSVWQYYQSTDDERFLFDHGAEIVIQVARLFAALATYDPADDRFDISGVMGPDEYHDGYPDTPGGGLRNNTYTNVLTAWVLARARDIVLLLDGRDCTPLRERLRLRPEEPARWDRISRRLRVPFHRDGIISQFEGYEDLAEFDWAAYRSEYGNIERLDLILQAEGDSTNRYKLSKQADVLMLFYLFSAEELRDIFERLGYALPPELIPRTVAYYLARTSHGSTLSRLAHAWVLARTDRTASWSLFEQALAADLADTQGGTTREGVHIGAMAGTADMVLRCYGGLETRRDTLRLHPVLPTELHEAEFTISYRGQPLTVTVTHTHVNLRLHASRAAPIRVVVEDVERTIGPGQTWRVPLTTRRPTPALI
ncbi:beta-phosphoglucomutase family hydrolase [Nocardia farcinica]|uniref:beta-phosphoglucomutase family hydrolase n=1 Tax=Nocardia farcinica TaxID=37329 RepID=UPI002453DA47|nr:beta-phosphoglucomutase family hydrolase [Nocardia farcinica]